MKNVLSKLKLTLASIGFIFIALLISSCDINEPVDSPIEIRTDATDTLVEFEYRINNVVTLSFPISLNDSVNIYLYEVGLTSALANHTKTIVHKFTDRSEYYDYADLKGVPAEIYDEITDSLAYFAELFNMDSILETDKEVPLWWFELEESVYNNSFNFGPDDQLQTRSLISQLNDNWRRTCRGLHNDPERQIFTLPGIGIPSLGFLGWRNRVSGFMPLFIGGFDQVFQRAFYRRRIATIWSWGLTTTDFCGPLANVNNRSNSWWSVGI